VNFKINEMSLVKVDWLWLQTKQKASC